MQMTIQEIANVMLDSISLIMDSIWNVSHVPQDVQNAIPKVIVQFVRLQQPVLELRIIAPVKVDTLMLEQMNVKNVQTNV